MKIRGFRIELGEIEAVLAQAPGVRESVVVVRQDAAENRRLVAYIVGDGGEDGIARRGAREAAGRLPDYMVPAQLVRLDAMPLTSNGKIDRDALPIAYSKVDTAREFIPPQTPVENTLARLWSEVLGVTDVGRDDNFFALGGHSLLVVKLLERIRRAGFAADVPTVFSNPVLSAMAAAITMEAGEDTAAETGSGRIPAGCNRIDVEMVSLAGLTQGEVDAVCAVVPGGAANVQDIYPLLHQQEGILFHHQLAGDDAVARTRSDGSWPSTGASGSIGSWPPCNRPSTVTTRCERWCCGND